MKRILGIALAAWLASAVLLSAQQAKAPAYPPPAQVKAEFLRLLDRPRVLFNVGDIKVQREDNGLVSEHFRIATEKKADGELERMPVLLYRPEKRTKKLPVVIVLHGTGGNKEGMRPWLLHLAGRGFIALAIDARYHGERVPDAKGSAAYQEAITRAWQAKPGEKQEHPFYYDTVWDLWRLVDYLETREDVDPARIGMIGISMGGIQTWLAAAVDDRIQVAVPAIAVQSFRWSLENNQWQGRANTIKAAHAQAAKDLGEPEVNPKVCRELWNKIIPGILDSFDCPSMIRLFAGDGKRPARPLLILSGEKDGNCPLGGARLALASAEQAYQAAGASDRLKVLIHPGGHTVPNDHRQAALDWFEKWLKP
jgi:dienelactone hydrolase